MNPSLKYRCGECGDSHNDHDEALECCPPQINEVYLCGHCHEDYGHDEDAAENCCDDVDPDALPIASQQELEAAGQMRLCA